MSASNQDRSIIILVNTLIYPARRNGLSVRYFPVVRELVRRGYTVDVLIINKYGEQYTDVDIQELGRICRHVDVIKPVDRNYGLLGKWLIRVRNVSHLLSPVGRPYELIDNLHDRYLEQLHEILATRNHYSAGIGVSVGGYNAELLLSLPEAIRPRQIICDFVDSAYLLKKRARISGGGYSRWFGLLEEWKMRRWERALCRRCPCIYISKTDAELSGGMAHVIPNTIVEDGYDALKCVSLEHPNIAFFGNMAYPPNAEAGAWLAHTLFPELKKALHGLHLYIIGRNPDEYLQQLDRDQNIHITGEVENIWDYINSVDVFVFTLFSGAGMQNKVLEAMYAGKPVVCTPIANEGIDAVQGEHIYLADSVDGFVEGVQTAFNDNNRAGRNAAQFVIDRFSVDSMTDRYVQLLSM